MDLRISINPRSKRLGQAPLDIAPIMQLQTNWCWAACAQMVTAYYGNDLAAQCDFANWNFSQNSCCVNGATAACDRPSSDPRITAVFSHWGINSTYAFAQVSYTAIQEQISVGHPVEIGWAWGQGGGHVVLLVGSTIIGNGQYVYINDPGTGQEMMTYADLQTAKGGGLWDATWTNIVNL